jgi:Homeodomain-like domain
VARPEMITMSMREVDRLKVIQGVVDGNVMPSRAAQQLDMSRRQIERLVICYRAEGATSLALWIARLGGYLNRKHDRPLGPTVMWRGFLALHECTEMDRIFQQNA